MLSVKNLIAIGVFTVLAATATSAVAQPKAPSPTTPAPTSSAPDPVTASTRPASTSAAPTLTPASASVMAAQRIRERLGLQRNRFNSALARMRVSEDERSGIRKQFEELVGEVDAGIQTIEQLKSREAVRSAARRLKEVEDAVSALARAVAGQAPKKVDPGASSRADRHHRRDAQDPKPKRSTQSATKRPQPGKPDLDARPAPVKK